MVRGYCLTLLAIFIAGCAATGPKFEKQASFLPGHARVYIFRPGFSKADQYAAPMVYINSQAVFPLRFETYTSLSVQPGKHSLKVRPQGLTSSIWSVEAEVTLEAEKTYYVAIWNNVETGKGIGFLPTPVPLVIPKTVERSQSARIEVVSEADALPMIQRCSYIKPENETIHAR